VNPRKLLARITLAQNNVRFSDLVRLVEGLGFEHDRTAGSHRVYIHGVHKAAQLNLQPDGAQAKPYQVRQLLKLVEEYDLRL
jgi:predicted RNA binding protein YcfA (HicA-like mRNA interferase family)